MPRKVPIAAVLPDAGRPGRVPSVCDARDRLAAGAHDGEQRLDAVDAVPEQVGVVRLQRAGAVGVAAEDVADLGVVAASLAMPGLNRSDELEKTGTLVSLASSKIAIASASEPATGLSMKTGLPALSTGRTCSRCGRPSTLSSSTTSTFSSSASIESTISTP